MWNGNLDVVSSDDHRSRNKYVREILPSRVSQPIYRYHLPTIRHSAFAHTQNRRHTEPSPHYSGLPCRRPGWNTARTLRQTLSEDPFYIFQYSTQCPTLPTHCCHPIPIASFLSWFGSHIQRVVSTYRLKHSEIPWPCPDSQLYFDSQLDERTLETHKQMPIDVYGPTAELTAIVAAHPDINTGDRPSHEPKSCLNRHTNLIPNNCRHQPKNYEISKQIQNLISE